MLVGGTIEHALLACVTPARGPSSGDGSSIVVSGSTTVCDSAKATVGRNLSRSQRSFSMLSSERDSLWVSNQPCKASYRVSLTGPLRRDGRPPPVCHLHPPPLREMLAQAR
eukprot:7767783-Prorocentrum_lima.AAC.1